MRVKGFRFWCNKEGENQEIGGNEGEKGASIWAFVGPISFSQNTPSTRANKPFVSRRYNMGSRRRARGGGRETHTPRVDEQRDRCAGEVLRAHGCAYSSWSMHASYSGGVVCNFISFWPAQDSHLDYTQSDEMTLPSHGPCCKYIKRHRSCAGENTERSASRLRGAHRGTVESFTRLLWFCGCVCCAHCRDIL